MPLCLSRCGAERGIVAAAGEFLEIAKMGTRVFTIDSS